MGGRVVSRQRHLAGGRRARRQAEVRLRPQRQLRWAFILVAVLGAISFAISLFGLLFAIIQAPTAGWGSAQVLVGFVVAFVTVSGMFAMPFNPLHSLAFHALDHAYNVGYFVCGAAAAVSFVLAAVALGGRRRAAGPGSSERSEGREPTPSLS